MKRRLALAVIVVATVVLGGFATQVKFDNSIEVWFLEKDPDLVSYREFTQRFDSDQIVVLAWRDPALWTPEGLEFVHRVGESVSSIEHVQQVRSITTLNDVVAEPGLLAVRPLYDPDEPPEPAALKERVLGDELFVGTFVGGDDGQVVALILTVDHLLGQTHLKREVAAALRGVIEPLEAERGLDIAVAGPTLLDDAFLRHTQRDSLVILPLMMVVIVVTILLLFRSRHALLLPLAVVSVDSAWVTGATVMFGGKLTIIHGIIYPMLLGIGIATSVHLLSRTLLLRRGGLAPQEAADEALRQLLVPSFFTAATTVAGLSSLNFSTLAPLRQFGQLGASGVASAFVLSYGQGPWLLPRLAASEAPATVDAPSNLDRIWARWDSLLAGLGELALGRARWVMAVSVVLLVLGLWGLTMLQVGSNPVQYFQAKDPVRVDLEFVDAELSGTSTLEVLVDTGVVDGVKEPDVLRQMRELQDWLESIQGVGRAVSLADYVMELRRVQHGGADSERRIPDQRREVAELLLMLDDPDEVARLVDFDFREARITTTVRATEAHYLTSQIPVLDERLRVEFTEPLSAQSTGMSKLIANMDIYLLNSAIRSIGMAFVTVLLFMTIALRSIRLGLFSMIPNILPVAMVIGVMGWVGIALDPGTTLIGAVALGLVVDNTVHFLHHLRGRVEKGDDIHQAVRDTLMKTGRAVVTTTVVLVSGFWLMLLASFNPNIYFGLLCGLAIAFALVADLVVLPAALVLIKPKLTR